MILRNLGKSGLRVSLVGLGCNNFGQRMELESSRLVIHKALDCGITLFDTADVYGGRGGAETRLGRGLGGRPQDILPSSKIGMPMGDLEKKGAFRPLILAGAQASPEPRKNHRIHLFH